LEAGRDVEEISFFGSGLGGGGCQDVDGLVERQTIVQQLGLFSECETTGIMVPLLVGQFERALVLRRQKSMLGEMSFAEILCARW
jgi:hypothetical protein